MTAIRLGALLIAAATAVPALAQTLAPGYEFDYSITNLGAAPGVPLTYGGCSFLVGDPDTLLLGGNANTLAGAIWAVPLTRDANGHITGFAGPAVLLASAPGLGNGGVDGSIVYFPGNVLTYGSFPDNSLGQIKPGSVAPDKLIDLTALGVVASVGGHIIVPPGFPGAGRLKIASYYPGAWYDSEIAPDGNGTFDILKVTQTAIMGAGPEAIVYVDGDNPLFFGIDVIFVTKFDSGRVDVYTMDANGDPLVGTEYAFINGLYGAEGMTFDPATGDLVLSTFDFGKYGGDEVFVVTGFNPTSCSADLNGDGTVDGADFGALLANWQTAGPGDFDRSGLVDGADLGLLLAAWGPCG